MAPNEQMAKSHWKKDSMNSGYAILKIIWAMNWRWDFQVYPFGNVRFRIVIYSRNNFVKLNSGISIFIDKNVLNLSTGFCEYIPLGLVKA